MSLLGLSPSRKDCSFSMGRPLLPVWPHSWADWEDGGDRVGPIRLGKGWAVSGVGEGVQTTLGAGMQALSAQCSDWCACVHQPLCAKAEKE